MGKGKLTVFLICILSMTVGCSTPYQSVEGSFTGGHATEEGTPKLTKIKFMANGFTDSDLAEKYALYRCAEYARSKGAEYFIIYGNLQQAAENTYIEKPLSGQVLGKPTAFAFVRLTKENTEGAKSTDAVISKLAKELDI